MVSDDFGHLSSQEIGDRIDLQATDAKELIQQSSHAVAGGTE